MQSKGGCTAYAYERAVKSRKRQYNVYRFSIRYLPEEAPVIIATFLAGISVIFERFGQSVMVVQRLGTLARNIATKNYKSKKTDI